MTNPYTVFGPDRTWSYLVRFWERFFVKVSGEMMQCQYFLDFISNIIHLYLSSLHVYNNRNIIIGNSNLEHVISYFLALCIVTTTSI